MAAAQRAAWDAYVTLTVSLLPALRDQQSDDTINAKLGGVTTQVLRYAPLWGEHGPMLAAALHSAGRLYRDGERGDLLGLLQAVADRLYLLSAGPSRPRRDGGNPSSS